MFPPFAFHLATLCKESRPFTACRAANRRLPGSGPSPVVAKGLVVGGDDVVKHVHLPEAALIGDVDLPHHAQVLHRQHGDLVLLQLVVFVEEKVAQKGTKKLSRQHQAETDSEHKNSSKRAPKCKRQPPIRKV